MIRKQQAGVINSSGRPEVCPSGLDFDLNIEVADLKAAETEELCESDTASADERAKKPTVRSDFYEAYKAEAKAAKGETKHDRGTKEDIPRPTSQIIQKSKKHTVQTERPITSKKGL